MSRPRRSARRWIPSIPNRRPPPPGAWYTYEGDQLGQGKENARNFLRENEDTANEIEKRIKEKLGVGARLDADATSSGPASVSPAATVGNGAGAPRNLTMPPGITV